MKILKKFSIAILVVAFIFSFTGLNFARAATAPNLGVAAGYSVFGNAGITETPAQMSHLWGNAGGNGLGNVSLIASQVDGSIDAVANVPVVGAISSAYGALAGEVQTGSIDLATSPTVVPGVYNVGATAFNSTLTLNGPGVYIFRSTSSIAQTAGGTMLLTNGACADNVFWQIPTSMTFAAPGNIEGTIITNTGLISFVSGVSLKGRAWAATQVTMNNNQITEPVTCVAPTAQLMVTKVVVGGAKVITDFPLFIDAGGVTSGILNTISTGLHTISETSNTSYTSVIGGDCATDGTITLSSSDVKICTITNTYIAPLSSSGGGSIIRPVPPLIDVVKVPSPLALPAGPDVVTYTYTLHNIGIVPVSSVAMIDDNCSPLTLISGDTNIDSKLDTSETWIYTCKTNLTKTTTNTVVATGWANGISATDVANATVVVGVPVVPPLIHVTKIPNPLALLTGSGMVTYTEKISNPGTIALSNIRLIDDKCSPMKYISGDINNNLKLETTETWTYTCQTKLTKTTTNTATASGEANGLTAKDFAFATVVVTNTPSLPKTGFGPLNNISWNIIIPAGVFGILISFYLARKKQTN